jgi:hypothetical protein
MIGGRMVIHGENPSNDILIYIYSKCQGDLLSNAWTTPAIKGTRAKLVLSILNRIDGLLRLRPLQQGDSLSHKANSRT